MSENLTFDESPTSEEPSLQSLQIMAETDIKTPPAQDSPKNIVNILNDDCLQSILLKLDDINDFWRAAQVCTRFQDNAKKAQIKRVEFRQYRRRNNSQNVILFDSAKDFLSMFGPQIKSLHCYFEKDCKDINQVYREENLRSILEYCGKTLNELEVTGYNGTFDLLSPLQSLKKLKLWYGTLLFDLNNSSLFPELQSLEMASIHGPVDCIVNQFPKLQHVKIDDIKLITNKIFIEFQRRNPQLQSLHVSWCKSQLNSIVWKNIADRLPNITRLSSRQKIGFNITYFSTLRHLKCLKLLQKMSDTPRESRALFSSIVKNNQPIEELNIRGVDLKLGRILQKLQTIKVLHIYNTPEDVVIDLVENLPALKCLYFNNRTGVRLLTVKRILQNCKQLTELYIRDGLNINETLPNEFDSIVTLATGRVQVSFIYYHHTAKNERCFVYGRLTSKSTEWVQFRIDDSKSRYWW